MSQQTESVIKRYWEERSVKPFTGTDETKPESALDIAQQHFIEKLVGNSSGILLKVDLWNESVRRGVFNVEFWRGSWFVGLDVAKTTCRKAKTKHVWLDVINADIKYLPFKNDVFDTLLDVSTSDHLPFTPKLYGEYYRIMKPKATFLLIFNKQNSLAKVAQKIVYTLKRTLQPKYDYSYAFTPNQVRSALEPLFKIQISQNYGPSVIRHFQRIANKVNVGIFFMSYLIKASKR